MRVGVLKPDHLGDLVLAAPAVAALRRRFADLTLFCHPKNLSLAAHLFPGLRALPLRLPHLDKDHGPDTEVRSRLQMLRKEIDLLIGLRWDGQSERLLSIPDIEYHTPGPAVTNRHVAVEQRELVAPFTGWYDLLDSYTYPGLGCRNEDRTPDSTVLSSLLQPRRIGLCISAGFRLNAWPMNHWLGLAERLDLHALEVVLIGGPLEVGRLRILAQAVAGSLGYRPRVIVGSNDFGATLQQLAEHVDLVVATDSGTAHLASLVRPVVSLFGGSPWRRFAPLGRDNVILTRRYGCSPCQQFNRVTLNTCHTQECLTNLTPEQVYACLLAYLGGRDFSQETQVNGVWMARAPWEPSRSSLCGV